jgi:hypothetical protein
MFWIHLAVLIAPIALALAVLEQLLKALAPRTENP